MTKIFDFNSPIELLGVQTPRGEVSGEPPERWTEEIRRLDRRADRLALACQALWELLREHTQLTDDDLLVRMQQIDLRDGTADGRMTPVPVECPSCHRRSNSRRDECLYCGARLPGRNIIERLGA